MKHLPTILFLLVWPNAVSIALADNGFDQAAAVLEAKCVHCHNHQEKSGGLSLVSRPELIHGSDNGRVVELEQPEASVLVQMISGTEPSMPPDGEPLSESEVDAIREWIRQGVLWPEARKLSSRREISGQWWSLRPLLRPDIPIVAGSEPEIANPIDRFILARLHEDSLVQAPLADRRTLIRRVTFDLTGLPPTFEEVQAFCSDLDPWAYEKLVERLLSSPRYGERWARHWLDVVHYGETHGYDKDQPRPNAWPYRDYVIRAFNDDKPYAQFIREQIAGDVLFPNTLDGNVATGFIAAGPWDLIGHAEVPETKIDGKIARHLDRDDMVSNTMNTFQSITVHCAQCHDHKFDPVSQEEYYSLQSLFAALDRADRAFDTDPIVAHRRQELLGEKLSLQETEVARLAEIEKELAKLPAQQVVYCGTVHTGSGNFVGTGASGGKPRSVSVLLRGDVTKPDQESLPGALNVFPDLLSVFDLPPGEAEGDRRAALAYWLSDERNPLTWRSIVNRVWLYHFGRGIVDTPNDFGRMGDTPSHPELLDWLAIWFRDEAQGSLKALHRLVVNSRTYQQESSADGDSWKLASDADESNVLLWRQNRRRLEAEAIRDSLLASAGSLDLAMGGVSFQDFVITHPEHSPHYEYQQVDVENPDIYRRSIYRFIVRSQQQPWMAVLDCADPSMFVDKRYQTITPLQALAQLNNPVVLAAAKQFAERLDEESTDIRNKLDRGIRIALQREPTDWELDRLTRYALQHGMENTCRVIFNLNEFVFVD